MDTLKRYWGGLRLIDSNIKKFFIPIVSVITSLISLLTLNLLYFSHRLDFSRLFNSDALFLPSLYRDFSQGLFSFKTFYFSGATFFFPDWILYAISRFFGGTPYLAIPFYFTLQIMFLWGLSYAITRIFFPSGSIPFLYPTFICVFLVFFDIKIQVPEPFDWPYSISLLSVSHFGEFLSWTASTYIVLKLLSIRSSFKNPPRRTASYHWTLLFLIALTTFSDRLFLVNWTLPAIFSFLLLKKFGLLGPRLSFILLLDIFSGTIIGYSFIPKILGIHSGFYENGIHIGNIKHNGDILFDIISEFTSRYTGVSLCLASLYVACFIGIANFQKDWKHKPFAEIIKASPQRFLSIFLIFTALITIFAMWMSADFILSNYAEIRYMIPVFLGPIVFAPILLRGIGLRLLSPFLAPVFLTIILLSYSLFIFPKVLHKVPIYSDYYPENVRCIDSTLSPLGVHKGISPYWQARYITMLSQKNIQIVAVNPDTSPYLWISNKKWYLGKFDFAIIPEGDKNMLRSFLSHLGKPISTAKCPGMFLLVYGVEKITLK